MRVSSQRVDTTCTAIILNSFLYDDSTNRIDDWENQKQEVIARLNLAKREAFVNVIAFLVGGTQSKSAKQLEELGFKCVADYYNYKYPVSSKNLLLLSMDMNNWALPEEAKVTGNPFTTQSPLVPYSYTESGGFSSHPTYVDGGV